MFWHLLLSEQREQLGRQPLCCPGRQLIGVFAKARDRRQCRGKSRRQHKRTDYRGADRALATRQPASERARLALAELYPAAPPDPKLVPTNILVEQVQDWLKRNGLPPVSAPTVKRVSGRWSKHEYG